MNPDFRETNTLAISWHDSTRIPHLNPTNVLDYFCDRCNPFYEKNCSNEMLRMQNRDLDQLTHMKGVEYIVLHVQEPILYVIRKQKRLSPTHVFPLADYYILAGIVYQAPDLQSILNSRLMTGLHHLSSAFDETLKYMRYHPTKGYSWNFNEKETATPAAQKDKDKDKEKEKTATRTNFGSNFQRRRVDLLLSELAKKFPPKTPPVAAGPAAAAGDGKTEHPTESNNKTAQENATKSDQSAGGQKRPGSESALPASKISRTN